MRRKGIWLLSFVLLAGLAPALWAENHEEMAEEAPPPAPTFMYVWTDHVSIANAAAYEAAVKDVTMTDSVGMSNTLPVRWRPEVVGEKLDEGSDLAR